MPLGPVGGANAAGQSQVQKIQQDAASGDFNMPDAGSGDTAYYMKLMAEMQAESRAFGSSRTRRAASTAHCSTSAARRSSSASSRSSRTLNVR